MRSALMTLILFVPFLRAAEPTAKELANWPHWRGPLRNGLAPQADPPLKWDEKTNIRWKVEVPGRGASTPIVWENQVFVQTALDTGREAKPEDIPEPDPKFPKRTRAPKTYYQFLVLSYDRQTGKELWRRTAAEVVPHEGHHRTNTYAGFSPVTDGKYLYVFFGSRGVHCYDLQGNPQWSRDLGDMHTRRGWGEGGSPVLHGDSLIINFDHEGDSKLYVLDVKTGKTKWSKDRDEPSTWATPLVVEGDKVTQLIMNGTNRVRSYDLKTGDVLWACGGQSVNAIPSPVAQDGVVYVMSGYEWDAAYAIPLSARGDITGTDKVIWRHREGTPYVPSPLLYRDRLYFTQSNRAILSVLDPKTGKAIVDKMRLEGLGGVYASPVATKGRIYIVDREGATIVLEAGDKPKVLATNRLEETIDASPVLVGKQIFLRGEKSLYCIEER